MNSASGLPPPQAFATIFLLQKNLHNTLEISLVPLFLSPPVTYSQFMWIIPLMLATYSPVFLLRDGLK
jgi:hypothetical protein